MKNFRKMCAVLALGCVFALPVRAGDMSAGYTNPPPPPRAQSADTTEDLTEQTTWTDETTGAAFEVFAALLRGVLSAF